MKEKQKLHLYGQYVQQISGDPGNVSSAPSMVSVFEIQLEELDAVKRSGLLFFNILKRVDINNN